DSFVTACWSEPRRLPPRSCKSRFRTSKRLIVLIRPWRLNRSPSRIQRNGGAGVEAEKTNPVGSHQRLTDERNRRGWYREAFDEHYLYPNRLRSGTTLCRPGVDRVGFA